ncbi:MAG TPA: NAD(P)-dependent oxidoreductase [Dinghuibacter sp.]|jgi:putative NADH-flavin reductase|uniref:NAD(P)-dependent oxidoreductase n=1 Tax=Dinghuibacter sp. TaxID=2024697 RepID=UPI002CB5383E|nr:NAD(P)-dependent oxidoreductase [Dinghuibacter sp.]HTJ12494.1 NAD(P)-dependent oxidoreductase [Dinghuibacter sp.]
MKIAIIGASGFVGTALTQEALRRGHTVTGIARDPSKIIAGALAVKGDVFDKGAVATLVKGHDAVLNAYNAGWTNPKIYDDFMAGSEAIEAGTRDAGVRRLIVIGGAGSLFIDGHQLVDSPGFPAEWKQGALAARDYLNVLRKDEVLDWTFLSPPIHLVPGDRTGVYRTGKDSPVFNASGESTLSVNDLAVAVLDALEKGLYIRERFTVGY